MKILKTGALCVLTCLCYASTYAQQATLVHEVDYNKPKIFADLPHKLQVNEQTLETLLKKEPGEKIHFAFGPQFNFQGVVVSKSDPATAGTQTVVIKSTNRQGATLTISRNTHTDGTYNYIGRLLSFKHGDAYEITQENGQFVLVKKHLHDLFDE